MKSNNMRKHHFTPKESFCTRTMKLMLRVVTGLVLFIRNLVVKWIYKPARNWWNPSPYCAPVTPAEFYALLESNAVDRVKQVLGAGRNPNALVPDPRHPHGGSTGRKLPLTVCVTLGRKDMTEVLVRHGANPFKTVYNQMSPLELAVDQDKVHLAEAMLRLCLGMKSPRAVVRKPVKQILAHALYQAVMKNNSSMCRLLLQYDADPFADQCISGWEVGSY